MKQRGVVTTALSAAAFVVGAAAHRPSYGDHNGTCKHTDVLILGAGITGITAAATLANNSIHDFMIIEYHEQIGGRARHTNFGTKADGTPYVVELGANWVQGLGTPPGPENPIWTLAKKSNISNTYSDYSSLLTYDSTGANNFTSEIDDFENTYWVTVEQAAGYILTESLKDNSFRAGLSLAGWFPNGDPIKQAVEWWEWDWETAYSPEDSSELFGITGYNLTFYQYSEENNYVWDQRGFNTFIKGLASEFLEPEDSRLLLNTTVVSVDYAEDHSVTVHFRPTTGATASTELSCITARHAITTFSLGVLQQSIAGVAPVTFTPPMPYWKQSSILTFNMGIYTKIFLQFDPADQFWDEDTQFFLYADPDTRGYYPLWQSLTAPGFLEGSGILFVTVVGDQSRRVEAQSDDDTLAEVLAVLKTMFGDDIPQPKAFMYPRWGHFDWSYGSYSNWPTGVSLLEHQNLRANLGRLWFAGEHTSAEYFGFLHGGYFEGQTVANLVTNCLKGKCVGENRYPVLRESMDVSQFTAANGWTGGPGASFVTYGLEDDESNPGGGQ